MKWLELHIDTTPEGLEPLGAFLGEQGIDGLVIDEEGEFLRFLEENRPSWDYVDEALLREKRGKCRVTFYLEDSESGWARLASLRVALEGFRAANPGYAPLLLSMENLSSEDWENSWKQYYKPIPIGTRLLVVPAWERAEPEGRVTVTLDPGLMFGTGNHATTRLCLEVLERRIQGGERVLDLGCGSGILSIAALRLGAREAFACDINETCVRVARANAALNGIGEARYTIRAGDITGDAALRAAIGGGYDIAAANIVADVILRLAPECGAFLRPGGRFLCSGIIDTRAGEVEAALRENGWAIEETWARGGWFAFLASVQTPA